MKGASKVIMGATLVMVVSLAIVLGLVLVLLAELYCTLLLRRRQLRTVTSPSSDPTTTAAPTSPIANTTSPDPPPHQYHSASPHSYYAPGVFQAPRNLFFPAVPHKENKALELHHILDVHLQESDKSPQRIGILMTSPSSTSLLTSPHQIREIPIQVSSSDANDKACGGGESFVYISNPIYDNDASRLNRADTPFETPDTSPSRLERGGSSSSSSGEEEITKPSPSSPHSLPFTPPLTPMKKLPAEACSVSLTDARNLGTSGSDSVSNNGISSSSSGSPCTSPSW